MAITYRIIFIELNPNILNPSFHTKRIIGLDSGNCSTSGDTDFLSDSYWLVYMSLDLLIADVVNVISMLIRNQSLLGLH